MIIYIGIYSINRPEAGYGWGGCVHIYTYICKHKTYTYTFTYIYTHLYIYIYVYIHKYICASIYEYIHIHTCFYFYAALLRANPSTELKDRSPDPSIGSVQSRGGRAPAARALRSRGLREGPGICKPAVGVQQPGPQYKRPQELPISC